MFASVIIDQDTKALDKEFEYKVPDEMHIEKGMRVFVPFGSRVLQGFVVDIKERCNYSEDKIKKIVSPIEDFSAIKPELLELMKFMCEKYHLRLTSVLRLFIPAEMREGKVKEIFEKICILKDVDLNKIKGKKQIEIIDHLKNKKQESYAVLRDLYGYSALKTLIEKGYVDVIKNQINRIPFVFETNTIGSFPYSQYAIASIK